MYLQFITQFVYRNLQIIFNIRGIQSGLKVKYPPFSLSLPLPLLVKNTIEINIHDDVVGHIHNQNFSTAQISDKNFATGKGTSKLEHYRIMDLGEGSKEPERDSTDLVDLSSFLKDTLRSHRFDPAVPECCRLEECCMGIDEAGRGPVLG